ncbi:hypothetical protein AJ80_00013 [Polytolypa hystricis UAMH7299]|uniref:Nitrate reductase [NADPH] n=1 Tax=Polytolypa hystricis (strain UAMH7299) TaxID=1447883 RepID=A0A2B7Z4F9_POLH7|nr:hypothetical protein AJ80_00013 [Polytolypa hystricis UAMH7299]
MYTIPWRVKVTQHPGSTQEEIENEPNWERGPAHRIGFKNSFGRVPGVTHPSDEWTEEDERIRKAWERFASLGRRAEKGDLLNFRDIITNQESFHLRRPENRSLGWRYVLETTEDWVKNQEAWPANIRKRLKEEEQAKKQKEKAGEEKEIEPQQEHEWTKEQGADKKHHEAYASAEHGEAEEDRREREDEEYQALLEKYSPQEIALLRALRHENDYMRDLRSNDGNRKSPQTRNRTQISIDEVDQFSPDNWIPRSSDLIRLTGKHPLNAEPSLTHLLEGGLITPNEIHYVRNHGDVPRLLWEFHEVDIHGGKMRLSMDNLKNEFEPINIPVLLACDGNRRKELNMIKKSKGFNWGAGGVSCAYWKGPLLRDVLLAAGVPENLPEKNGRKHWVHFEGADELSRGTYSTCIPFRYAMDPINDVILAYEMNDLPLPPDHGYPVRVIIPGYIGGRSVKWLSNVWISDSENTSHYHIWDNRVLPNFITEMDGEFAKAMFHHPDTACNEQNLNSVIARPAQGEKISLKDIRKGRNYRIEGYAYHGGGHKVQRVEVSLDDGKTWLYCIRKFPENPIRHGYKFWTWLHWHVDVEFTHLIKAQNITVRCFDVFKNTQPEHPIWNLMGMMNNCWYVVKSEITVDEESGESCVLFRHPTEPAAGKGGWKSASYESQIASAKQESGIPQKQFTREEIEKHDKEDDCWIVIDGKVYDATSVLAWHPGGKAPILAHAGKVHLETTSEFESIHDDFARQKLKESALGVVTEKAKNLIKWTANSAEDEKAKLQQQGPDSPVLQKHRWVPVRLLSRKPISEDTRTYTFELPGDKALLGMDTCQHIEVGFHMSDRMLIRPYTPTRPLLPASNSATPPHSPAAAKESNDAFKEVRDGSGTFDLTIKTYFPTKDQPGGAMSNILDCMPIGEEIEIRGPRGDIIYQGNGNFDFYGKQRSFSRVSLIIGGSGITPGFSLIARILLSKGDKTAIRMVNGNKAEGDILLRDRLEEFARQSNGQLEITHVLSEPQEDWKGLTGFVTEEMMRKNLFEPSEDTVALMCGPPIMIKKAVLPGLTDWGYVEGENMFGF